MLSVAEAKARFPNLEASRAGRRFMTWMMNWMMGDTYRSEGWFPDGFRRTMGPPDERLPELASGLGVIVDGVAKFYPADRVGEGIDDTVGTRSLRVAPAGENGLVEAVFVSADSSSRPLQLLTRWYGFAYTYPGCEIYGGAAPSEDAPEE